MAQAVVLKAARSKMLKARRGDVKLPVVAGFVFGIGGVDEKGNVIPPDENNRGLTKEIYRKTYNSYEYIVDKDKENPTICRYICVLDETELANRKISEIGLYDSDGDIIAVKTFSEKGKDNDIEMSFIIDDSF